MGTCARLMRGECGRARSWREILRLVVLFFLYDDDDEEIKNVNFDVNLRHDEEREETREGEDGKCRMTKQISGS